MVFFTLRVTFVNFSEDWIRKHFVSALTIMACLPVRFSPRVNSNMMELQDEKKVKRFLRVKFLRALHHCVELRLEPQSAVTSIDTSYTYKDGKSYLRHLLLISYIADFSEAEDMLSVKSVCSTFSPGHACSVSQRKMKCPQERFRTLKPTMSLINRIHDGDKTVGGRLKELSMLLFPPVLSKFTMVGITLCVDIFALIMYEPMHALCLGASHMMRVCHQYARRSQKNFFCNGNDKQCTLLFSCRKRTVVSMLNGFLRNNQKESVRLRLSIHFSKSGCTTRISGLYSELELLDMLEAYDSQTIANFSPFLGGIIDQCRGDDDDEITRVYTKYIDVVNFMCRTFCSP